MLGDAPVSAVLPATDIARVKDFYVNKLGLKLMPGPMDDEGLMLLAGEGSVLVVYKRPEPTKAEHTVAGFKVENVEQLVKDLEAKGVQFEDYDMPNLKTVDHIATFGPIKSAWFKDTEGNIVSA